MLCGAFVGGSLVLRRRRLPSLRFVRSLEAVNNVKYISHLPVYGGGNLNLNVLLVGAGAAGYGSTRRRSGGSRENRCGRKAHVLDLIITV